MSTTKACETATKPLKAKTILVVDDQEAVRLFVAHVLGRSGYTTLIAETGEEAIEIADQRDWLVDVVVSDLQMPGLSGLDVGHELSRRSPEIRVLIMTAADLSDVKVDRGWGLLGKPFTGQQLIDAVRHALNGHAAVLYG
jgi:CheY-like chemotaxis protein